jgi:hypothetical protein
MCDYATCTMLVKEPLLEDEAFTAFTVTDHTALKLMEGLLPHFRTAHCAMSYSQQ